MWLYKLCRNLPAGHCVTCSDAGCLSSIGTYLPGTVVQGCRLFKQCWSLPAGHCVAGVLTISAMSEPTCRALCCSGAGCLRSVGTYTERNFQTATRHFLIYLNIFDTNMAKIYTQYGKSIKQNLSKFHFHKLKITCSIDRLYKGTIAFYFHTNARI